jgi:hypothetical protein
VEDQLEPAEAGIDEPQVEEWAESAETGVEEGAEPVEAGIDEPPVKVGPESAEAMIHEPPVKVVAEAVIHEPPVKVVVEPAEAMIHEPPVKVVSRSAHVGMHAGPRPAAAVLRVQLAWHRGDTKQGQHAGKKGQVSTKHG